MKGKLGHNTKTPYLVKLHQNEATLGQNEEIYNSILFVYRVTVS